MKRKFIMGLIAFIVIVSMVMGCIEKEPTSVRYEDIADIITDEYRIIVTPRFENGSICAKTIRETFNSQPEAFDRITELSGIYERGSYTVWYCDRIVEGGRGTWGVPESTPTQ